MGRDAYCSVHNNTTTIGEKVYKLASPQRNRTKVRVYILETPSEVKVFDYVTLERLEEVLNEN